MSRKKKKLSFIDWVPGIIVLGLAIIYTILVKVVDVASVSVLSEGAPAEGVAPITIGFASINIAVRDAIGTSSLWYNLTKVLAIIVVVVGVSFFIMLLNQWVKKKAIKKLDRNLVCMMLLYVVLGIVYLFFEKVIINYRPILDKGQLEASFPSSHTMLVCTIMGSAMVAWNRLIKNATLRKILMAFSIVMIVLMPVARLLSGVHWLTDIIGGLLYSGAMVCFYIIVTKPAVKRKPESKTNQAVEE